MAKSQKEAKLRQTQVIRFIEMEVAGSDWKTVNGKRKKHSRFSGIKKKRKNSLNGITPEDLLNLHDVELSHSNLFKMQVEELLKELAYEKEATDNWLESFSEFVKEIPESSASSINEFIVGNKIKVPISLQPVNVKGCFKFSPPSNILRIGSHALETTSTSSPIINIALEIPKACWQGNDYLNYRYHRKRALYLAYVAKHLNKSDLVTELQFCFQNDCDIKPELLITPKGIKDVMFCVCAYPCEEAFKESRFDSDKNNVRAAWFFGKDNAENEPTPFYNSTILADLLLPKMADYLEENLSSHSLKGAVIMLKIWARHRGLVAGYGRLNGFLLTSFLVSLLKKRIVSPQMSSYEVFKCALLSLSEAGLVGDFFKEVTEFNVLYSVSNETLERVQHEAQLALIILDNLLPDTFNLLFMKKVTMAEKFEYVMHLRNIRLSMLPKICEKMKEGLKKRIILLDAVKNSTTAWSITSDYPNSEENIITIGFLLNPEVPHSNLEKGPVANNPEAKVFREFWGKQSELRRFQDGSVREAVFWPAETIADRRQVFCTMLKDILERHFKIPGEEIQVNGVETEGILQIPNFILCGNFPAYGTGEEAHYKVMQSFNELSKQLRTLDLPLQVASVQGTSPSFRFTEVFPPLSMEHKVGSSKVFVDGHIMKLKKDAYGVPPYVPALKAIVHFEGSGKWPDDVEALRRVKAAFHIKIAENTKSQLNHMAIPFVTHTDVFKEGYVFRLEVACHKEIFLMKQMKAPDGSIKIKETKESHDLEVSTEVLPKLNGVLYGLHQQHSSYGAACRIAKRWVAAQLKQGFVQDITVDLLVAYLFVHPEPLTCPGTPQVAFIRFLSLLITHNWVATPLIINLNNELKAEDIEEINTTFTSMRSTLPPMVIVTPFDRRGNMWTKNMPPELILKRIIILAEASLDVVNNVLLDPNTLDVEDIFRPPLGSFDVIIHLQRREIPKLSYAVDILKSDPLPKFSPYEHHPNELYPVVDFDPVQKYLEELKANFGEWAVFLNDPYGGDVIAVKWKSTAFKPENAKTYHGCKIIPNVEEILENIQILGEGLIKNIEYKTHNWQLP